jgi:class 3 adenylate cyclase
VLSGTAPSAGTSVPLGATVTLFFSDIRGFTEYTEQHGDEAAFRVLQNHNSIVRRQVELFGGHVVKTQGDSFMVTFGTARAAIQCAVAVQRALAAASQEDPGGIALGIGINTGEPIQEGGDFFGSPVNLAARICAKAGPGQVLVSETTRFVAGRLEAADFVDRGLHELKGFQELQRLYEVRWTATGARIAPGQALQEELTALSEQCGLLGQELVETSRAMKVAGTLPASTLGPRITALRSAFSDFRGRLIERAGPAGVETPRALGSVLTVGELQPVVAAIVEAESAQAQTSRGGALVDEEKTRQIALEAAVQRAIGVLNRVLAIAHRDDPAFQPLLECQARATELRLKLSRMLSGTRDSQAERVEEAMMPFADLVTLAGGHENIDDQQWMQLEENAARVFGRPLVIAATRGRLVLEGAEARSRSAAPAPEPARRAEPSRPEPAARPRAGDAEPPRAVAPPLDPRGAAVGWWATAHSGWAAWKASGMATAHALRAALTKHSHVLSVPIQDAAEYDGGRLPGSYFPLLEHVENQSPGFMRTAIERALEQTGGSPDPAALGRALYELLAGKGRLGQTYPSFVRDVMVASIPTPGVWVDAAITEEDEATIIVTRPSQTIGDSAEQPRQLTELKDRLAEHRFTFAVRPFTTRFVCLRRGNLKDARDVEVKLTEKGEPADAAWLLTLRSDQLLNAPPKRVESKGTALPGFGKTYAGLWVGCFNTEPQGDKRFEIVLTVRPAGAQGTARRSAFGARPR